MWIPVRYIQVTMMFTALIISYMLRVNLSVGIVAMTSKENNTNHLILNWNERDKSFVLSSFFWGYLMLQIIIGNLAEKYGTRTLFLISMASCSLLTVIIPVFASYGWFIICIFRMLQGIAQGIFFPCTTVHLSKWLPEEERTRFFAITFSGTNVGTLTGLTLSGYLAHGRGGWPSIFYVTGGIAAVWLLLWFIVGASSPSQSSIISINEKNVIESSLKNNSAINTQNAKTPWKKIFTSVPVWAIIISHLGQNWGFWTLLTQMPNYIHSTLGVNIKHNSILSSLPYLVGWICAILFAVTSDYIYRYTNITKIFLKKLCNTVALWGCAAALLILALLQTKNLMYVEILLVIAIGLNSGIYNGYLTNHVDLSPNFCGTLMGISNTIAGITSILGPLCVGFIVQDSTSELEWKTVFLLSSGIMFVANLFYIIFASTKIQPWNNLQMNTNTIET